MHKSNSDQFTLGQKQNQPTDAPFQILASILPAENNYVFGLMPCESLGVAVIFYIS